MKNMDKLCDYLNKYTRDFIVVDKNVSPVFNKGFSDEFTVDISDDDVIASYKYPDGNVKVFWGGSIRFTMHGIDCVLLTECHTGSDDLLVLYNNMGYAYGVRLVQYGDQYVHI